ncbi:hypothetical protein PC128_g17781 [Phytophthora cactorum]|nr:hypothetical protein PC120_g19509 [Phytophthora cactorum]KAG3060974.1 hypothetical protein PC121_g13221 [Phytophthora cactorum]KAG3175370.1 hypothetical protein PC128_g17781 [Phytophthora cactorum]
MSCVSAGAWVFNASYHKETLVRDDTLVQYTGSVERTQQVQDTTSSLHLDVSRLQELKRGIFSTATGVEDLILVVLRLCIKREAFLEEELHEGNDMAGFRLLLAVGGVPYARHTRVPLKPRRR